MKKLMVSMIIMLIVGTVLGIVKAQQDLRFYVLDVGQGSASLARLPDGENVLIDGGPDAKAVAELGKVLPFYDKTIDLLVITHSHDDHIGGLIDVFERYQVNTVIYTGVLDDTQIYKKLLTAIQKEKSKVVIASAGQELCFSSTSRVGDVQDGSDCQIKMKILYPISSIENKAIDNPNDGSVVTVFEQGKNKIVVTGDLEIKGEGEAVDVWQNKINFSENDNVIYVAGHHGSSTSSSKKFLDFIKPDYAIISVGKKNKFGHPSLMILERLKARAKEVWRTDEVGSIEAYTSSSSWTIRPFQLNLIDLFK